MTPEYLGNNLYREYLGVTFLQELKETLSKAQGSPITDLNEGNWRMEMTNANFRFVKFDLEYVYYERIVKHSNKDKD